MNSSRFLTGLALCAGIDALLFAVTWAVGHLVRRWNVVDTTWGLSFVAVAIGSYVWSAGAGAATGRRALVLAMVALWGVRLGAYVGWRGRGRGEDPRYAQIMARAEGSPDAYALKVIFLPQFVLAWLISVPVQIAMYETSPILGLTAAGVALWTVGVGFETVGDAQMQAFRNEAANRGTVMDRGLWRYTRHPNYFGDACVWFGLYLVAASAWQGALTFASPLVMLYFLYFKSGKGLLERNMARDKPGYRDYMARTSGFLPMPPRRSPG